MPKGTVEKWSNGEGVIRAKDGRCYYGREQDRIETLPYSPVTLDNGDLVEFDLAEDEKNAVNIYIYARPSGLTTTYLMGPKAGQVEREYIRYARARPILKEAEPSVEVQGIVYLLKAGPFYKIGKTSDMQRRLNEIRLQLPYPVTVEHTIQASNPDAVEIHWHRHFAHRRANGEWFLLTNEDVAEFKKYKYIEGQ